MKPTSVFAWNRPPIVCKLKDNFSTLYIEAVHESTSRAIYCTTNGHLTRSRKPVSRVCEVKQNYLGGLMI